jgi:hypothetical protein
LSRCSVRTTTAASRCQGRRLRVEAASGREVGDLLGRAAEQGDGHGVDGPDQAAEVGAEPGVGVDRQDGGAGLLLLRE